MIFKQVTLSKEDCNVKNSTSGCVNCCIRYETLVPFQNKLHNSIKIKYTVLYNGISYRNFSLSAILFNCKRMYELNGVIMYKVDINS